MSLIFPSRTQHSPFYSVATILSHFFIFCNKFLGIRNCISTPPNMITSALRTKGPPMAKEYKVNTNTFSIAHYILLFLVTILCIGIISWVMIRRNNPAPQNNIQTIGTYAHQTDPCVHRITNTVAKMWAYTPDMIPERYWDIAMQYLDETITTRTYGLCQDVAFTCRPG